MNLAEAARRAQRVVPHYDIVAASLAEWRKVAGSDSTMLRAIEKRIVDEPVSYEYGLQALGAIPQDERSLAFGEEDLRIGCTGRDRIYRELTSADLDRVRQKGLLISSAFTVWHESNGEMKGRFVVNLHKLSKFFRKRSVRMERAAEFCGHVRRGDHMLSFDVESGYRHLRLHPSMRDYFCFEYNGKYYQCLAPPVGMASAYWFTRLLSPVIERIRSWGCLVLVYLDDVLVIPRRWGVATARDCRRTSARIDALLLRLGVARHPSKGCWGSGSQRLRHLGFVFDTRTHGAVSARGQTDQGSSNGESPASRGAVWAAMGKRPTPVDVPRRDNFVNACGAARALLQPRGIPVAERELEVSGWEIAHAFIRASNARLALLGSTRPVRQTNAATGRRHDGAFGRFGSGLGRNGVEARRRYSGTGWGGRVAGNMDTRAAAPHNHVARTVRHVRNTGARRGPRRRKWARTWEMVEHSMLPGQQCMPLHSSEHVHRLKRGHATITPPERRLEARRIGLDVQWLPSAVNVHADRLSRTWIPGDIQLSRAALRLLRSWFSGRPPEAHLPVPQIELGAPQGSAAHYALGVVAELGRRRGTTSEPAPGLGVSDIVQVGQGGRERAPGPTGLAEPDVVPSSAGLCAAHGCLWGCSRGQR